nr:tetratricopeptide repeat protein [Rickettsia felis]
MNNNDDVQQLKQYKINGDLFMNVTKAIQEYDKAISFNPSDPDTYLNER